MRLIERVIHDVLSAGREHVNEQPKFLEQFFGDSEEEPGLGREEIDSIQKMWLGIQAVDADGSVHTGVSIIHQFPRDTTKLPCWAIVLLGEQEETQVLGDEAGFLGDDGEDVLTSIYSKSYAIFTYATNPIVAVYYYELCRFFMTRGRPYLKSAAGGYSLSTKFSGGDMAPDPRYVPANLFVRRFQIDLTREERVLGDPQVRGTKLRGIFSTPEGPEDVQDVTSLVDTYIGDIDGE